MCEMPSGYIRSEGAGSSKRSERASEREKGSGSANISLISRALPRSRVGAQLPAAGHGHDRIPRRAKLTPAIYPSRGPAHSFPFSNLPWAASVFTPRVSGPVPPGPPSRPSPPSCALSAFLPRAGPGGRVGLARGWGRRVATGRLGFPDRSYHPSRIKLCSHPLLQILSVWIGCSALLHAGTSIQIV